MGINYTAPPTCARFMKSDSFGRLIAGPVGSGKTTACIFELFRRACEQEKADDGYRYTRFAIVRQTLKQLKDTVLKDIISWLSVVASYKVTDQTVYIEFGDVRSEWLLIPLDDPEDQKRLLSMQLTGAWMSECIEMDVGLVSPLSGRVGRYPSAALGGASWMGIIADTNMPTEGSPWHKFMEDGCPPDWQIFIQPGGMSLDAENLEWLVQTPITLRLPINHPDRIKQGRTYYERFIRSNSPDWCTRFVHAKYGPDPSGTAVFRESFKHSFHVVDTLDPVHNMPLVIGQDFGRDPWSIICQPDHKGRLLVLEEVEAEDIGLELHISRSLRPKLQQPRYMGRPMVIIGDPSGRSKDSLYEETSFDMLKRLGFMAFPAPTNDIDSRLRAVDTWLMRQADGGAAIVFDKSRCPQLVRAMNGGYRYAKTRLGMRKPLPDKNEYSQMVDALQYACLATLVGNNGIGLMNLVTARLGGSMAAIKEKPAFSAAAWT
jgi:hypothetical protein